MTNFQSLKTTLKRKIEEKAKKKCSFSLFSSFPSCCKHNLQSQTYIYTELIIPHNRNKLSTIKMFKYIAILASLVGAAAFAPAGRMARSSALKMDFSGELGVIPPTGFFDPLGLSSNIDQETFEQYRASELKHGRVAQLAVLGYIVPEVFKFPGDIAPGVSFQSIPNGVAAIEAVPALGWMQMFFLIGAVDYYGFLILGDTEGKGKSEEELEKAKLQELQHGRLAMLAILELLRHDSQMLIGGMYTGDEVMGHMITGLPFLY